jgi:hypothetical protein
MKPETYLTISFFFLISIFLLAGCGNESTLPANIDRESKIPSDAIKMTPAADSHPPVLLSDEFDTPVPLDAVNTAGGEDSPFIMPDGNTLYFFFTPDVRVPAEKQVIDGVTGIYVSKRIDGAWQKVERVMLERPGKAVLDGCEFVLGDTMWFCTAREGYTGIHWFTATMKDGVWKDWKESDFDPSYEVGELHISSDGNELFFHSARPGGKGGLDIWSSEKKDGEWQSPANIAAVNSADNEGWPYVSSDGKELWFLRSYKGTPAIFRSKNVGGGWQEPELIVETFAGEPTLDDAGNLYFVHHYYKDSVMIEADIYLAKRRG